MKMGRHGRYVKRTAAFLLSAVLAAGLLSGCGKGKTEEQNKENTSVKGRYVENDMELPIQEGEKILNMAKSKDGNPVLFSEAEDTKVLRWTGLASFTEGRTSACRRYRKQKRGHRLQEVQTKRCLRILQKVRTDRQVLSSPFLILASRAITDTLR